MRPRRVSSPLIPLLLANFLFSVNPLATLFWSLRLLLYLAFITSLKISPRTLAKVLLAAVVFQVFLGAIQVFTGHSLGGIFTWLGESVVAVGSPGIATASLFGQTTLRAYGAFGHPNALAGWLVIVLLMVLRLSPRTKQNMFFALLVAAGVLLTQSRSGMLALFGLVIPFFLIKTSKMRFLYYSITLLLLVISPALLSPSRSDRSLAERRQLQNLSFSALKQYPIFGTGAQASIATYPSLPQPKPTGGGGQPDHNSLTLFLSWFGVFGVLAFLYSLRSFLIPKLLNYYFLLPLLPLLLLDHYLLTSPSGLFILTLYLRVTMNHEP